MTRIRKKDTDFTHKQKRTTMGAEPVSAVYDGDGVVKCGVKYRRTVSVSPCQLLDKDDKSSCERDYLFYLPKVLCEGASDDSTMILPMLFVIHCYGCTSKTLWKFGKELADTFNFVLALPIGRDKSWNAQQCCRKAKKAQLNDIGFFQTLIDDMARPKLLHQTSSSPSSPVVVTHPDLVYGVGWSNGGYMTMYSAALFRAIAPISGYQIDFGFDEVNKQFIQLAGLQRPLEITKPTPMFLHQAVDDPSIRSSGCCTDPSKPACCCGLSTIHETCSSVEEYFKYFGRHVNGCQSQLPTRSTTLYVRNKKESKSRGRWLQETKTSTYQGKATQEYQNQNRTHRQSKHEDRHNFANITSNLLSKGSRKRQEKERSIAVTCQTAQGCDVNTTLCIHSQGQHFKKPSFYSGFPMANDVADFFARDACQVALPTTNAASLETSTSTIGNTWSSHTRSCTCGSRSATASIDPYCLRECSFQSLVSHGAIKSTPESGSSNSSSGDIFSSMGGVIGCMAVVIVLLCSYLQRQRKHYQNGKKHQGNDANSDDDKEETLSLRLNDENATMRTGSGTGKVISRSNTTTKNQAIEMSNM